MNKTRKILAAGLIAAVLGFSLPYADYAVDNAYSQIKTLMDVMGLIRDNYVEDIDVKKLVYGACRGMVDQLDDFSQFMEPDVYDRVKGDTDGEFGGIGITIDTQDGWPTVVTPLPGTPAFKLGVYPGDKIIKIEGESTKDMIVDEVVKKLRGKPGTKVKITTAREPEKKGDDWITRDIEITRDVIKSEVVKYKMLQDGIGYIKVVDFSGHVMEEFNKALSELGSQKMQALVVDLRFNPGGLLSAAVDMSRLFIDSNKMIVYTKGRKDDNYQEFRANVSAPYKDIPIVILVNRYSASASEIVTGALQDNKRALVVGENTFGKASVQTMMPLGDGSALRLTIAHYYTPSGKMIHRNPKTGKGGIDPDIEIKISREDELKLVKQMGDVYYPSDKNGKKPAVDKKAGKEEIKDQVLDRAVELLKARDVLSTLSKKA